MEYIYSAIAGAFLAATILVLQPGEPQQTVIEGSAPAVAEIAPANERESVALALLIAIGNPQPTGEMVSEVVAWSIAEDGGSDAMSRNNPWNTTQCGFNMVGSINGDGACGVGHYATMEDGIAANAATLAQANFSEVRQALLANDPEGFKRALWASGWAESRYGGGADWPHYEIAAPAPAQTAPAARAVGEPYVLQGDVGVNVTAALNANDGALMGFTIPPGGTWSFGRAIKPISAMGYLPVVCGPAGCYAGGGWCDLSALYVRVADQLGLQSSFPVHAGVSDPRFPGILLDDRNDDGDLTIFNPTSQSVTFQTRVDGDRLIVEGG